MPTFRDDMAELAADLQAIPEELGMRTRIVKLRSVTVTGRDAAAQIEGTKTITDTAISPVPAVRDGGFKLTQYAMQGGGVLEEGDLLVENIPRAYSEAQLRGADQWVVDDVPYRLLRLVEGALFWEAFLRRARA